MGFIWSGCVHVVWTAVALEGYRGSRILEAESIRCTIHCIHEHVTDFWTDAGQVGLRCIEINFEMLQSMEKSKFNCFCRMLQPHGFAEETS